MHRQLLLECHFRLTGTTEEGLKNRVPWHSLGGFTVILVISSSAMKSNDPYIIVRAVTITKKIIAALISLYRSSDLKCFAVNHCLDIYVVALAV